MTRPRGDGMDLCPCHRRRRPNLGRLGAAVLRLRPAHLRPQALDAKSRPPGSSEFGRLAGSADFDQRAAINRQGDAGDEIGFVRRQEQRRVGDVPAGAHLAAQRHPGVAHRGDFGAAAVVARARVSAAVGVSISPGRMQLARMPQGALCNASCSVKAIIAAFVAL